MKIYEVMKIKLRRHFKFILLFLLLVTVTFGVLKQIEVNRLNETINNSQAILINGFHMKPNLNYNFDLVEKSPSKENIVALARELSFNNKFFYTIITLNEEKVNNITWQMFKKNRLDNECVNYILSLSMKESLTKEDKEDLSEIKKVYNNFLNSIENDTTLYTTKNITSLTSAYIEFITKIGNIIEK